MVKIIQRNEDKIMEKNNIKKCPYFSPLKFLKFLSSMKSKKIEIISSTVRYNRLHTNEGKFNYYKK